MLRLTPCYTAALISAREDMTARILYRTAAVLLVLFVVGHTLGFRQNNPDWGASSVISLMQSVHFNAMGFNRSYWDFFSAFGFYFSVFLLVAAALAWQLGESVADGGGALTRRIAWTLTMSFVAVTALTWRYAFTIPLIFSIVITLCLIAAAWLSPRTKPIREI